MTAMIDINKAEKTFTMHLQGGVELPVVRGASFHVAPGCGVELSGRPGAGKSSILKMIFGNYRCDAGRIGIRHLGTVIDLATAEPRQVLSARPATIAYVSQFLRAVPRVPPAPGGLASQFLRAVPRVRTLGVVAEPLSANGMARSEAGAKAGTLL